MKRISVRIVESSLESLNTVLGLPTAYGEQGHIYLCRQNGYNNVYQQEGSGAKGLAYGLTLRQVYEWTCAVIQGIQMAKGADTSR